tara:strand:+ start:96 stop:491 length:396 start_codon:yes stop_codon:yes gene_type:complete
MKKINPSSVTKNESGARAPRISYMDVATATDANGKLTALPTDFDTTLHLKPVKTDFAHPAVFMEFRAAEAREKAQQFTETAAKYDAEADSLRKYGDPTKRKMAKRAQRLRDELAALEDALSVEGIDLPDAD